MNVEILGDDVCYDGFVSTLTKLRSAGKVTSAAGGMASVVRKASPTVKSKQALYMGDDISYGDLLSDIGSFLKSDTGKEVTKGLVQVGVTAVSQNLNPTDKAKLAQAQQLIGMTPQTYTNAQPQIINAPKTDLMPFYIVGGAVVAGLIIMLATKK